jgi:hypothetical protein
MGLPVPFFIRPASVSGADGNGNAGRNTSGICANQDRAVAPIVDDAPVEHRVSPPLGKCCIPHWFNPLWLTGELTLP